MKVLSPPPPPPDRPASPGDRKPRQDMPQSTENNTGKAIPESEEQRRKKIEEAEEQIRNLGLYNNQGKK